MDELLKRVRKIFFESFYKSILAVIVSSMFLGFFAGYFVSGMHSEDDCESIADNDLAVGNVGTTQSIEVLGSNTKNSTNDVLLSEGQYSHDGDRICVEVAGAVVTPGMYCFDEALVKTAELIDRAGGYRVEEYASRYVSQSINLAESLIDGQKVYIPFAEDVECKLLQISYTSVNKFEKDYDGSDGAIDDGVASESDTLECIDINLASVDELDGLDGIGLSTAQSIIDARPYTSIEGLLDVSGIGEQKYESISQFLCEISS